MWKCKSCKETCEDTFDSCWNCGTGRDGAPPAESFPEKNSVISSQSSQSNGNSSHTNHASVNANNKSSGIGFSVIGGAGLLWVFARMTSLVGKLHTWSPPFDSYETTTIVVGLVALLCLTIGIRKMSRKPAATDAPPSSASQPQTASSGELDFRKLSKFIAVLGVIVVCYGGFRVSQSLPLPAPPPDNGQFKGWGAFLNNADPANTPLGVELINRDRARARTDAYKIIGVGALILFGALAIERSAKRPRSFTP